MWGKIKQKISSAWGWIKRKWKQILVALGIVGTALAVGMPKDQPILKEEVIQAIEAHQTAYFREYGRYKHGFKAENWKEKLGLKKELPFEIEIHQFIHPNNECGYKIFLKWEDAEGEHTKAIGYGPHAQMHTWERVKKHSTTTTTPL